jgi:outer membrane protein assembly factor BamB
LLSLSALGPTQLASPHEWTQFLLNDANNAALPGRLQTSWHLATKAGFSSAPAIVDGTLYVGNNGGQFYALDPRTGRVRWRYTSKNPLMTNPLIYNGVVIIGEGNQISYHDPREPHSERLLIGTGESAVIGLDARTGGVRWRVPTRGSAMPTGAIVGALFVHHDGAGYVRAIDPKTGAVRYERFVKSVASMSALVPLSDGTMVTAGTFPAAVIAFNAGRGAVEWKREFARNASGIGDCPPATDGTRIFCNYFLPTNGGPRTELGQSVTQHVYAIDGRNGTLLWDVTTQSGPLSQYNEASIPLIDAGVLFEGNSSAYWMNALDARTGKLRWRTHLLGTVKGGVAVKDGVLYFGDSDGHLWALDKRTGRVIGVKDIGAEFAVGSPLIAGDTLIIASRTGSIIALPLASIRKARDA